MPIVDVVDVVDVRLYLSINLVNNSSQTRCEYPALVIFVFSPIFLRMHPTPLLVMAQAGGIAALIAWVMASVGIMPLTTVSFREYKIPGNQDTSSGTSGFFP